MAPTASPRLRRLNGTYGAVKRHHPDADTTDLRRELAAVKLEDYIASVVDAAPPLSATQRDRLAALLRGGGTDG